MGDIEPIKQGNGPSRLLGDHEQLLILQAVGKDSRDVLALDPACFRGSCRRYCACSNHLSYTKRYGLYRTSYSTCCYTAIRRKYESKFMAEISIYEPSIFVWLDE